MGRIIERVFPQNHCKRVVLWRKCLSHVLARFGTLPLALHTWTAAPSKQQAVAVLLAFRSAPSRFTPRLHYTISNKPEYCILRSCVSRSSSFSSAKAQWNVKYTFCWKILFVLVFQWMNLDYCIIEKNNMWENGKRQVNRNKYFSRYR